MKKLFALLLYTWMGVALGQGKIWLIDVRTPDEYRQGHLAAATNIEYQHIAMGIVGLGAGKQDEIRLYCHSGRRAGIALDTLKGMGYTHVENLGGIDQARRELTARK